MSKSKKGINISFERFLLLDVLREPRTRPVLAYVGVIIVSGAVVFHLLEGWSWLDSFYFVVITLTTIGYGDLAPTTPVSKLITIFFALNGVAILVMLFDAIRHVRTQERVDGQRAK